MLLIVVLLSSQLFGAGGKRIMQAGNESENRFLAEPGLQGSFTAAQVDTYCIVWYRFETMNWQGWTREEPTAQHDEYWHVDNFVGLPGDPYGPPWPLEGTKSMWCGVRTNPSDPYLGSWRTYGYGNNWDQWLVTDPFPFANPLSLSYDWYGDFYHARDDRGDGFVVEYYVGNGECGDSWVELAEHCFGLGCRHDSGTDVLQIPPLNKARTKLRFRLISDFTGSAQSGGNAWGYRGAIVDSITISDASGVIDFEDFEAAAIGAGEADSDFNGLHWKAEVPVPYGKYSGLKNNLTDKDPCGDDFGTQIVFFIGSTTPSSGYPGLFDTPFCGCSGGTKAPCQDEMVISPIIDMTRFSTARNQIQDGIIPLGVLPNLGGVRLEFDVYRDLPLPNLVFYYWSVRNIYDPGYYGAWLNTNYVYYGSDRRYFLHEADISSFVLEDAIQVSLHCVDMCDYWYLISGDCAYHTPAPWFDNVRIYAYENIGPQWSYNDIDLFQDNFPSDPWNIESYVFADAACDENPSDTPPYIATDYIKVRCTSPKCEDGIRYAGDGWPEVYMHVRCTYIGHDNLKPPELVGSTLQGNYGRYVEVSSDGHWTIFQASPHESLDDEFTFDLNDELFTRGYMIEYYFSANDECDDSSTLPAYAHTLANATYPDGSGGQYKGVSYLFEFTCLPTLNSDILYVDDYHGRGSFWGVTEDYWNSAFTAVIPSDNLPDRYDVNGPTQFGSNGLGSRASSMHLNTYWKIIWDSGDLSRGTISDGVPLNDKSPDCQVLTEWMELSDHDAGLWVCGDGVAKDLADRIQDGSAAAAALMNDWCGVDLSADSYFDATGGSYAGGIVNPLVTGTSTGIFYHAGIADKWYALGGCPGINNFDVLTGIGDGFPAALYPDVYAETMPAAIQASKLKSGDNVVRTMWFGFSFMYVRDTAGQFPAIRNHILKDIIEYMENTANADISGTVTPTFSDLAQNYPNPFNPVTTISYDVARRGPVRISIYNAAGQLVRTLVDEMREAGRYTKVWDGRDNQGVKTGSGVYFCRMESGDFNRTRKMVILR